MKVVPKAWSSFDARCADLVAGRLTFEAFCRASSSDFDRMVRIATRKRRAPASIGLDDLVGMAKAHAWHYLFRHRSKAGVLGFDATRGTTPGAYVRFNVSRRLQKDLSRARGENQHRRDVKTSSPEVPTPDGFDPGDVDSERDLGLESSIDRRRELEDWKANHAESLREHLVMQIVIDSDGDDRTAACLLLESAAYRFIAGANTEQEAVRLIGTVLGTLQKRMARATKETA